MSRCHACRDTCSGDTLINDMAVCHDCHMKFIHGEINESDIAKGNLVQTSPRQKSTKQIDESKKEETNELESKFLTPENRPEFMSWTVDDWKAAYADDKITKLHLEFGLDLALAQEKEEEKDIIEHTDLEELEKLVEMQQEGKL